MRPVAALASLVLLGATRLGCVEPPPAATVASADPGSTEVEVPEVTAGRRDTASTVGMLPREDLLRRCLTTPLADRLVEEGERFAPDGHASGRLELCDAPLFRGVASRLMTLEARLVFRDPIVEAELVYFEAPELNGERGAGSVQATTVEGVAELVLEPSRTGELGLAVALTAPVAGGTEQADFWLDVVCKSGCEAGLTRFPIVLLHGMGGTDSFLNLFAYFNGVEEALEAAGFDVFTPVVDPLASSDIRAAQLVPQLEAILADTGARGLNLIGHSQGGLDGRALIVEQDFADRVASLTTVATPHLGVPLADVVSGVVPSSGLTATLLDEVGDIYGQILGRTTDQSFATALAQLGERYLLDEFNPHHPDDARVAYYSWAGRTCSLAEISCRQALGGELVNPLLAPTYLALQLMGVEQNDGLVGVASAQWGEYLGVLPADHLAEVGLSADVPSESWDHLVFFEAEGDRLFTAGF